MAVKLAILSSAIFVINLPFGYWRARVRRRSVQWFLAIHLPVPLVALVRILMGIHWTLRIFPLLVASYFFGQAVGGRFRRWIQRPPASGATPPGSSASLDGGR